MNGGKKLVKQGCAVYADRQDGRCDGSIEHSTGSGAPLYYNPRHGWVWSNLDHGEPSDLTFLMCVTATEAFVQDVLFSSPGSVTTTAFAFFSSCWLELFPLCVRSPPDF